MFQINRESLAAQLETQMADLLKQKLELVLREEIRNFLEVEHPELGDSRNGYYTRGMDTRFGRVEELRVPRDRMGEFQTSVFEPYSRRDAWLEETIIAMYKGGMSTREVGQFVERILGVQYSPTTISNITNVVLQDVDAWRKRPLKRRYSVVYMDGMYVSLKRDTVENESIYVVMGIDENGHREILGYYVGGNESATSCREIFMDLRARGLEEILVGVADGLSGLKDAFLAVYPKADFQRCVVHKLRNTIVKVRAKDKPAILEDLKGVYSSAAYEEALGCFKLFESKWNAKYPREVQSWRDDLTDLLVFYKYPEAIRYAIYTTNAIERTIKEIRKRVKPMNSIANLEAAEKIVYLFAKDYNEKWSKRALRGFAEEGTKVELSKMFTNKYGATVRHESLNDTL
ncbi:IS256 family transposase [Alicyclobacillus ferrooxydans]|uniref:IS256 family transposase n=1 Tax=Alicyclobacillus ferrooxydans TaxID=471514 RepID=UPI000AAB21B3|nr:IS256 family transposase [Alicyclobacillus ferrooxydans]